MGGKSSKLKVEVSSNTKNKRNYYLTKEYHHNETTYYLFSNKKNHKIDKKFVKIRVLYGNKLLEKFTVSFENHDSYSVEGFRTIYKYSENNSNGTSQIILNVSKNNIETITYKKSDSLQFKIDNEII
tara:strand:+ start:1647 stop:2027 length:381 start_codon:yes stop_codon:yes gene_type:complete